MLSGHDSEARARVSERRAPICLSLCVCPVSSFVSLFACRACVRLCASILRLLLRRERAWRTAHPPLPLLLLRRWRHRASFPGSLFPPLRKRKLRATTFRRHPRARAERERRSLVRYGPPDCAHVYMCMRDAVGWRVAVGGKCVMNFEIFFFFIVIV